MAKNITQKDLSKLKGTGAFLLAVILLISSGLALWGRNFADDQVREQLVQEKIRFPEAGSPALDPEKYPGLQQYAGQLVDTGPKAKAYANEFIWQHMMDASDGRSFAEVSSEARANPGDEELADLRQTLFEGSMLRSSLLTAYAFSVFGLVAGYAALISLGGAVLLTLVVVLYFAKARRLA